MKQIGIGIALYVQDYDERLFFRASTNANNTRSQVATPAAAYGQLWWNQIAPYVKSEAIYACPSDAGPTDSFNALGAPGPSGKGTIRRSYAATLAAESLTLAQIERPAEAMVVSEKWDRFPDGKAVSEPWIDLLDAADFNPHPLDPVKYPLGMMGMRHHGTANCAFFDGHAKAVKANDIASGRELSGCALIHRYPSIPKICDVSIAGCTASPAAFCSKPAFLPYPTE